MRYNLFNPLIYFLILSLSIHFTSCSIAITDDNLQNHKWILKEMVRDNENFDPIEEVSLEFISEDEATGNGGCNGYWTEYTLDGNNIEILNFSATEMACEGDIGVIENIYFDLILKAESLKLYTTKLKIFCENGELEFEKE